MNIAKNAMNVEANLAPSEEDIIAEFVVKYFAADVAVRKFLEEQWDLMVCKVLE